MVLTEHQEQANRSLETLMVGVRDGLLVSEVLWRLWLEVMIIWIFDLVILKAARKSRRIPFHVIAYTLKCGNISVMCFLPWHEMFHIVF